MTSLAILMLVLGMLISLGAVIMWRTAVTDNDTYNLRSSTRIATVGRWTATTAILLWLGGHHQAGIPMLVLLLAAAAAAAASRETKPAAASETPRHV
jgi:hypothetical protein